MKERINEFDFVRAVCTLGIIMNHFTISIENNNLQRLFYTYPNGYGSVGYTLVTVFFILSGGGYSIITILLIQLKYFILNVGNQFFRRIIFLIYLQYVDTGYLDKAFLKERNYIN
jgi:peptidoglycan/LPS O-acetylase OafA/YrhL